MEKIATSILKFDASIGVAFGWAIVCKDENGEDYYDLHGDHIPEDAMVAAWDDFTANSRIGKIMHAGDHVADVTVFPLTGDIAKGLGMDVKKTGMLIAYKPHDKAMIEKFKNGDWTGFSIGGAYVETEELPDD